MDTNDDKREKTFYSMGEVAEMFDVNPSLIRFWEQKFDILRPKKNKKGNRMFTPEDLRNLKMIYHLVKENGMTLSGAQKRMKQNTRGLERDMELLERLQTIRSLLVEVREELRSADIPSDRTVIFTEKASSVSPEEREGFPVETAATIHEPVAAEETEKEPAAAAEEQHPDPTPTAGQQEAPSEEQTIEQRFDTEPEETLPTAGENQPAEEILTAESEETSDPTESHDEFSETAAQPRPKDGFLFEPGPPTVSPKPAPDPEAEAEQTVLRFPNYTEQTLF